MFTTKKTKHLDFHQSIKILKLCGSILFVNKLFRGGIYTKYLLHYKLYFYIDIKKHVSLSS